MPNTQTLIFQWGSIEVLSPVEKEEEIPGVFLCCRSLQKVNTQRKLYPSHSSPFPPVWLSRHRRLESLGGSCEGTVCQVAPGPVSHLPSCRAPAPFPLLRERRGSPGTAKEEQSIYWFVQVNILIRTRLLLSRKRRSYIVIKSHPFNQANEMLHKKKKPKHICGYSPWTAAVFQIIIQVRLCRLKWQEKPAGSRMWPQNRLCPRRWPSPAGGGCSPSSEREAKPVETSRRWYASCCHAGLRAIFN